MTTEVSEQITVAAPAERVYAAVSDVRRMARWSPECFAVWVLGRRPDGLPRSFVGWNRRAGYIWFTTCQVAVAKPGSEFAFDVTSFGQPISRWGYRLTPEGEGTTVTEYWQDRRGRAGMVLGRIFTGKVAHDRPAANRGNMAKTLARLKKELEAG
ncbi:hypothetical protein Rhe02_69180 [Rhizocola hellebori]|uniref:SRPBCC family protein n=1 Tax=Rhizocola hellebori TaxID=1392758 RepID=A0A8J3QDS4_9ACTN|nr:SRPBCC family protein [Rhizocola hellebori]GIH08851.1 hypothetical protein Rhe02_69180 [Rhizocola hellebori]